MSSGGENTDMFERKRNKHSCIFSDTKKETRESRVSHLAILCNILERVLDISFSPHDIISGCIPSRAVIVNSAELLVAVVHPEKAFNHLIERSEKHGLSAALANVKVSHLYPFLSISSPQGPKPSYIVYGTVSVND